MSSFKGFQKKIDSDVLYQAQLGDMKAIEKIYLTYGDACYNVAINIVGEASTAKDVLHDSFIKIINSISSFRSDGNFAGWVRQVVVRQSIDKIRADARLQLVGEHQQLFEDDTQLFSNNWLDTEIDLMKLFELLPVNYRSVLFLHEIEGYSHKEIASMFEKSESFSKVTLNRAYNELRKITKSLESKNASN